MIPTEPDTPPDTPTAPPTFRLASMSVSGNNENDVPAGTPSIKDSSDSAGTPRKHRPAPLHIQSEAEKASYIHSTPFLLSSSPMPISNLTTHLLQQFPCFLPAPKPVLKSKSLTEAEIKSEVLNDTQVAAIATQLQTDAPPMSLEEARQRRESIKDERKKSIDFIRRRTMSRASVLGRPNLEALNEPKFDEAVEGEKKD
ncbi:hypothetical protein DL98DRAFT_652197 [Cadophora sp. DSE1049]|nr:hypothetical protein DL98DRAFT_652197 [Cadophora sp. DSE1049]